MIDTHEKFRVPDEGKTHELIFEVNWNQNDPKSNECKLIRVTMPNGDVCLIKKEHLNAILFAIGTESEQRKLVPQRVGHSRHYSTVLGITATKDIRKGEKIVVPVTLTLPTVYEEVIGEARDAQRDLAKNRTSVSL